MNNRGQFSIIAALLVATVLVATVVMTYSTIRNSPIQSQPQVLSAIDETNFALKQILGFTVGYYGSVMQVTGNSTYAKMLATNYLHSGLEDIANMHPEWGTSFNVSKPEMRTYWFTNNSYSIGNLAVNYSLTGIGMHGITYETSCKLTVQIENSTASNQTRLRITRDEGEPIINLEKQNFKFYRYNYTMSMWDLINPSGGLVAFANGSYLIDVPPGVDAYSYVVMVQDLRGIVVVASSISRYTYTLNWASHYSTLKNATDATIVVELLQNGTMQWLGQSLNVTTQVKPIPPIPVKAIRVNQTINGVNQEVPFQIEDWASDYKIPLGLTNNASIFGNRHMLVFLVNSNVSKVTIWWNGSDAATQTSLAYTNRYFNDNPSARTLNNSRLILRFATNGFTVTATVGSMSTTANLKRINNRYDTTPPEWAYAIYNGTVRDIIHGESEYSGGVTNPPCYNFYSHIVLTLPANATYYTYQLRLIFLNSTDRPRNITDICPIKINTTATGFSALTENGTLPSGYPIVFTGSGLFYNRSNVWQHHWSQLNSSSTRGFGIMFTDEANKMLYFFDTKAANKTGALRVNSTDRAIELLPVNMTQVTNFADALDICWYGAVVTFDGATTPIYKSDGSGLWIIVEHPPTITVTTEN